MEKITKMKINEKQLSLVYTYYKQLSKITTPYVLHYLNEYNHKGTSLQRANKLNDWNSQFYKFTQQEVIKQTVLDSKGVPVCRDPLGIIPPLPSGAGEGRFLFK